jgi:hypothetical protein
MESAKNAKQRESRRRRIVRFEFMKTLVTTEVTLAEASEIQTRLEKMRPGPVRNVLARVLRGYIVGAGSQQRQHRRDGTSACAGGRSHA